MRLQLSGEITMHSGIDYARIYQDGGRGFILEESSEMRAEAHTMRFTTLEAAIKELLSHT